MGLDERNDADVDRPRPWRKGSRPRRDCRAVADVQVTAFNATGGTDVSDAPKGHQMCG